MQSLEAYRHLGTEVSSSGRSTLKRYEHMTSILLQLTLIHEGSPNSFTEFDLVSCSELSLSSRPCRTTHLHHLIGDGS